MPTLVKINNLTLTFKVLLRSMVLTSQGHILRIQNVDLR